MDMNDLRALATVLMFVTFLGIIAWAAMGRRDRFKDAANLPFSEDALDKKRAEKDDSDKQRAEQEKSS